MSKDLSKLLECNYLPTHKKKGKMELKQDETNFLSVVLAQGLNSLKLIHDKIAIYISDATNKDEPKPIQSMGQNVIKVYAYMAR